MNGQVSHCRWPPTDWRLLVSYLQRIGQDINDRSGSHGCAIAAEEHHDVPLMELLNGDVANGNQMRLRHDRNDFAGNGICGDVANLVAHLRACRDWRGIYRALRLGFVLTTHDCKTDEN
jgi:hypothetical protein